MSWRAMFVLCSSLLLACAAISGSHNKPEEGKMFDQETDERDLICFQHGTAARLNWDDGKRVGIGAEVSETICTLALWREDDTDDTGIGSAIYDIKQGHIVPIYGRLYKLVKFKLEDPEIKRRRGPYLLGGGDKACFSRVSVGEPRLDADAVAVTVGGIASFKRDEVKVELWVERIEMEGGTAVAEVKAFLIQPQVNVYSVTEAEREGLVQRKRVRAGEELVIDLPKIDFHEIYLPETDLPEKATGQVRRFRRKVVSVVAPAANGPIGWIELKE